MSDVTEMPSGPATPTAWAARRAAVQDGERLPAPAWATRSLPEDGGVVHWRICDVMPAIADRQLNGVIADELPSQVSITVVDRREGGVWKRGQPTIQVEGGDYTVSAGCDLLEAIAQAVRLTLSPTSESPESAITDGGEVRTPE